MNPNKPGKVRIVFDAAAEHKWTSLNKNLLQGPDCTNSLVGVLLRFREENIALVADIESMFHQIKVRKEDQDSLRFLWWPKSMTDSPEEYVMTVHIFGATDSPCAANFTLRRSADDNAKAFDPAAVETVKRNFYVDDLLKSVGTPTEAITLADQLVKLCAKGGFNLIKFQSNDRQVLGEIPVKKRAALSLDLDLDELPIERALGMQWRIETDTLGFKTVQLDKPNTMRGVLSTIASVFDPLHFVAPVMLPAKQIMQTLWKRKKPWDHPISGEILEKWKRWKNALPLLENLSIPRCYFSRPHHEGVKLQLHHFADASEVGYGTASYLRIEYSDAETECSFITGKSRKAPIKCVPCKKQMGPRMNQQMGDLPKVRLTPYKPPFTYSGVDYFGPFYVKRGRGRVTEKRWGVIFVCMNSRAVHLELAKSLDTDDFILVLTRFLNRRGQVEEIRSDNGTNSVGADKEIKEALESMKHNKVQEDLIPRGCNWVFHPPGASHMSGVWERLVRTVKRSLKAILGNQSMNEEVLTTVFSEAERIANSRPLTPNSSTPGDAEPLTPNHFLNVRPSMNIPPDMVDEKDKFSRKRWRQASGDGG